jgi:CheY-like chemotaxis protein
MAPAAPAPSGQTPDLPRILVADDQRDVTRALRLLLRGEGFDVDCADSPEAVLAAVRDGNYDVALIDLNYTRDTTSGKEGLLLLDELRTLDREALGEQPAADDPAQPDGARRRAQGPAADPCRRSSTGRGQGRRSHRRSAGHAASHGDSGANSAIGCRGVDYRR